MAITKKLLAQAEPIVMAKADYESMDEYIARLYDVDQLSLREIEIHLHNIIAGTEKVHGRQSDLWGYRKGSRDKQTRMKREPEQMDLFNPVTESLEIGFKLFVMRVKNKLKNAGIDINNFKMKILEWCRDFYQDGFGVNDTFCSIRDNINSIKESVNEDFGIGVGAPCGLDQGIPHGGDCKGCNPCKVAMVGHPPRSAALALTPQYWLNQIPHKKRKRKKKKNIRKEAYEYITSKNLINSNFDNLTILKYSRDQINSLMERIIPAINEKDYVELFEIRQDAKQLKNELIEKGIENKYIKESLAKFMLATTYFAQQNFEKGKIKLFEIHENVENLNYNIIKESHKKVEYLPTKDLIDESVTDLLKKIPQVIKSFKSKIDTAKKDDDKEKLADAQEDIKDLKDEIYDKGVLNKFRNNKKLAKVIFDAMAVLMLSAGATNAHAASIADYNLGEHGQSTLSTNFDSMFDQMQKEIDKTCADLEQMIQTHM